MAVRAEIISIGDELTSGQRLDTNSQWLSQQLGDLGVVTAFHTTVGDTLTDNVDAFQVAARRADIVMATGGLGPTADDLTREALSAAFDAPLELRQEALDHIASLFAIRQRPMPERNKVQAMFPLGSRIIDNPHGTAPGIDLEIPSSCNPDRPRCRIFALPGVPAEMKQMYTETVEKRLRHEMGVGSLRRFFHSLKVFGIGESDVEKRLPDLIHRDRDPIVGITVSQATITLRIATLCATQEDFDLKIQPTVEEIHRELGLLVFGEGECDIHEAVHELLLHRQIRIGVVEFGAGTWIQQSLAQLSDAKDHGLVAAKWYPTLEAISDSDNTVAPINLLKSDEASETAKRLARAAESLLRERDLDYCLAAGVYPTLESVLASKSLPSSDFTFALARRDRSIKHATVSLGAHPDVLYHRLAKTGLNFLRLELLQHA